jgi:glycosyltransferase involved in cell wall biosynthesis
MSVTKNSVLLFGLLSGVVVAEQQRIAIVIPSYNNVKWCEDNVRSALNQNYENYYVIYTSDASTDGTDDLVEKFLAANDRDGRVQFIKNDERHGALYNLYRMIHSCDDADIVLTLDGDDMLADEHVLEKVNEVYLSGDVWLTYGQFKFINNDTVGWTCQMPDEIIQNNAFREFSHLPSHLRTFKAWLFKEIRLKDLLYMGDFYIMTWDMAMMLPMIEMAGERHQFISDILYLYNDSNPLSDHMISRQLQAYLGKVIRAAKRYGRLDVQPERKRKEEMRTTVIVFSDNNVKKAALTLKSVYGYLHGFDDVVLLYKGDDAKSDTAYRSLHKTFPDVCYRSTSHEHFAADLIDVYENMVQDYVLFLYDGTTIRQNIDLRDCMYAIRDTKARGFYFKLHTAPRMTKLSPRLVLLDIGNDVCAWDFSLAERQWSWANVFDGVLYQKTDDLLDFFKKDPQQKIDNYALYWANEGALDEVGLCFKDSRITGK